MLTNHYNTLSKPISPKSVCCVSQTSVSLYRSAEERSYLSLVEARFKRGLLLLIWRKGTKNRIAGAMWNLTQVEDIKNGASREDPQPHFDN